MMPFAPRRKMVVSSLGCAVFLYLLLVFPLNQANTRTTVAVNPVFTATAKQSSCTAGIPNNDASLRLTSVSNGDRVNYSVGNTYTGDPDYANAQIIGALPYTIASSLTNPMGARDYTIRVFNGDSGTYSDVLVTLDEKICPNECSCVDYLYVNDPTLDLTHKFPLNPDGTVGPEVGSPWMPTGNITNPHGVVGDINGNLYIAQIDVTPTQLYQVSCDGTILNSNAIPGWNRTLNLVTDENTIYSIGRPPGGGAYHVYAHDICTGTLVNSIMLPDGGTAGWGLSKGEDDELYFTMSFANISHAHTIYHVEKDLSAYNLVWSLPQISGYNTHGVDRDEFGNYYVVLTRNSPGATTLYKIGPGGNTINTISDNSLNQSGFGGTWGIVYNRYNGKLYMGTLGDDCVAVVDAGGQFGNMTYEAASGVPHVPGTYSKAINIVRECCPNNVSFTLDTVVCGVPFGDEVHLARLISCDNGVFCEGNWSVGPGNSGINYDPCNQTISFNATGACGEFTLTAAGGAGTQCGAFDVTLNVGYGEIIASTIAGDQAICRGGDPAAFTEVAPASGSSTINYQWQFSTTDCNSGFQSIPGADGPTYDPPAGLDTTTYYRLITTVDASGCSSGLCRDTSNCITVAVTDIESPGLQNLTCNDNATPTIASDDYVTFSLNPTGDELPASYTLSVDNGGVLTLLNGNPASNISFGAATQFKLQNGSADGTVYTVTIDLDGMPNCPITFPISAASCSNDNVDLALIKTETSSGPYLPGDNVNFDITVYNQGTLPVTNVQVTDYIPSGFLFNVLDNPDFSFSGGNGVATIPTLNAGANVTLGITLQIDPLFLGTTLVNNAEITAYTGFADEDSTPGNNSGSMPELATDNDIDDESPGSPGTTDNPADEDDFDPAQISILQSFDLALKKVVLTAGPVLPGTDVDYKITVYNQGDIPGTNITVTDYIPAGHNFNAVDNADFALNGMVAEAVIPALLPGDSVELSITLEVDLLYDGATIINNAEITAATGGTDEDSTPGNNSGSSP
ncbi:MAG: DUF11 domain-containing protein, partial [Saprospiraceae bacterium]|nr:DUF11 domain-containing protein [Saprospiraceae bacterium]